MVNMSRRRFIRTATTLAGTALILAGFGDLVAMSQQNAQSSTLTSSRSGSSTPQPTFSKDYADFLNWLGSVSKQVSGRKLNISLVAEFKPLALQRLDPDFVGATNLVNQYNLQPYAIQLSAIQLATSTQSPAYDLFAVDNQNAGSFNQHFVSPFELATKYPGLTYPGLDFTDFDPLLWDNVATYPPAINGGSGGTSAANVPLLPFDTSIMVFFYRKDIYDKLGLSPPTTWDEYFEDVKMLSSSNLIGYGGVSEAAANVSIVYEFLNHLEGYGARLWAVDGNTVAPVMDTADAVAALENFVRFMPYSDPGSASFTWTEVFASLARGGAACGLLWNDYAAWLNDPVRSLQAGNFAFKDNPAGPKGSFSTFGGAGIGVSKYSRNPDAAWLWMQWATAKGVEEALLLDTYHIFPSRRSALGVSEVQSAMQQGSSYASARLANEIYSSGRVRTLMGFPNWFKALDILDTHLNSAWRGIESPRVALTAARQGIEQLGALTFQGVGA